MYFMEIGYEPPVKFLFLSRQQQDSLHLYKFISFEQREPFSD